MSDQFPSKSGQEQNQPTDLVEVSEGTFAEDDQQEASEKSESEQKNLPGPVAKSILPTDTHQPMRIGLWVLGIGFGGFLLWAGLAPLDEGVPTQGSVTIDTKRKPVQHLKGGIIKEMLVREGDMVDRGQVVARLDDAMTKANLESGRQRLNTQIEMVQTFEKQLVGLNKKKVLIEDMLSGIRDLVEEGYAPRARQLDLEVRLTETEVAITELMGKLSGVNAEIIASKEAVRAFEDELDRTRILAPVSGQVVGLTVQSADAVIQPAQKLMDVVPLDEKLLLEAQIPPHLIDRVAIGQATDVRFSAFSHSPSLVVEGKVESVSKDLVSTEGPMGPVSYYLARVSITDEGLKTLGNRRMQAGMPAEVIIKTGERSLLTYVLHPLTKRIASSMVEE